MPLVRQIERLGGVRLMLLSHRDDIADHAKFAAHFECPRVMHDGDGAARLGIEQVVTGQDAFDLDEGYCQLKQNRADRSPTYRVHTRTQAHHLGGRSAQFSLT